MSEKDKRGFLLANPPGIHDQNAALIQRLEDGYKAEVARLQAELAEVRAKLVRAREDHADEKDLANTIMRERDALRAEVERFARMVSEGSVELAAQVAHTLAAKAEIARLQAQYGTAVECAQTAIAERDALRADYRTAKREADALMAALDAEKAYHAEACECGEPLFAWSTSWPTEPGAYWVRMAGGALELVRIYLEQGEPYAYRAGHDDGGTPTYEHPDRDEDEYAGARWCRLPDPPTTEGT